MTLICTCTSNFNLFLSNVWTSCFNSLLSKTINLSIDRFCFYFNLRTRFIFIQSKNLAFLFAKCSDDSVLHRWLNWVPLGLIISWLRTKRRRRAAVIVVYSSAVRSADGRCFLTAEVELRAMVSPPAANRDAWRAMSATRRGSLLLNNKRGPVMKPSQNFQDECSPVLFI